MNTSQTEHSLCKPRGKGRCDSNQDGLGKFKFLIIAIDYFTKWIEAKPVATITGNQVEKFMWDYIVCRKSKQKPRRRDKGTIGQRKNWIEEIPHVLWAYCTMIKLSNGDTPFSLTYRTKVVIPTEIGMPTLRTTEIDMVQNDEALELNLDLLEEKGGKQQSTRQEAMKRWKILQLQSPQHKLKTGRPCVLEQ
nr:reverse transcriptase domain-containing protein [Tanacetum cinerariifolium]